MTDLYDTLGTAKDAPADELKAAYRRKAKKLHPDKPGGNAEAFAQVSRAWLVLRDPERRAKYDETGDEGASIDAAFSQMSSMIVQLFSKLMEQVDVDYTDLIGELRRNLKEMRVNSVRLAKESASSIAKIEKVRARLSFKGARGDVLLGALNGAIEGYRMNERSFATEQDRIDDALLYIDDYQYAAEVRADSVVNQLDGIWTNIR